MPEIYDRELIPTTAQQIDRAYPEWATSDARLKIHAAKTRVIAGRLTDREAIVALLERLANEGRSPCYDAALAAHQERHRAGKSLLIKSAYGG